MDKKRIHEMLEKLTEWSLCEIQSKGKEGVDTKEMAEAIDMVKDLAEAEKAVWEKCYYEKIVEAMKEEEEEMKREGRPGYDRWRYSSGRFAPKGSGHETSMAMATGRAGFDDPRMPNPYYDDPRMWPVNPIDPMGYTRDGRDGQRRDDGWSTRDHNRTADGAGRMGYTPDRKDMSEQDKRSQYQDARRYFHETRSEQDRMKMTEKGKEYVSETIDSLRDMFIESDPELQKKVKDDVFRLYREMGGK